MSDRKKDHITEALKAHQLKQDKRFYYEPALSALKEQKPFSQELFGKRIRFPLWISSMTGGTEEAFHINSNLAKASSEFGLGFGLGSCRPLLSSDKRLKDFAFREIIGDQSPFFGNLGIAQIEELVKKEQFKVLEEIENKLGLDGWIIHINPMQEWAQPEGDRWQDAPIKTIESFLKLYGGRVIVKEVGQGFGPKSLAALAKLPLAAIELAAFGGTNFTLIEQARQSEADRVRKEYLKDLACIGHSNIEMLKWVNQLESKQDLVWIFSGGLKNALDGFYLTEQTSKKSLYAQAGALLKRARGNYSELQSYLNGQVELWNFAKSFLTVRDEE